MGTREGRKNGGGRERQEEKARGQEEVTEAQDAKVNVITQQLVANYVEDGIFPSWNLLAIKRIEVQTRAAVWISLGEILLSKRSQTRKTIYGMIPFT